MGFAVLQSATHLARSQDLLSWASPGLPLRRCIECSSTPTPGEPVVFGTPLPHDASCSAPVDSHHLDGLLRAHDCGFVAPRNRPWGSPRFALASTRPMASHPLRHCARSPRRIHPSKNSPTSSRTVSPRPSPSCRYHAPVRGGRPDRRRSTQPRPRSTSPPYPSPSSNRSCPNAIDEKVIPNDPKVLRFDARLPKHLGAPSSLLRGIPERTRFFHALLTSHDRADADPHPEVCVYIEPSTQASMTPAAFGSKQREGRQACSLEAQDEPIEMLHQPGRVQALFLTGGQHAKASSHILARPAAAPESAADHRRPEGLHWSRTTTAILPAVSHPPKRVPCTVTVCSAPQAERHTREVADFKAFLC